LARTERSHYGTICENITTTRMDIVLITTHGRTDYLRLCLEYLSRAEGIQDKEIRICIDRGGVIPREVSDVVRPIKNINVEYVRRGYHGFSGNSFNTLESYKEAYNSDAKFVYLIENDVLVQPDFFKWHEAAQSEGDFMCSIAYRCFRNAELQIGIEDPEAYLVSPRDYASIGVCWKREKLEPVVQHANTDYYGNMQKYLEFMFPDSNLSSYYAEQDGLIMRILERTKQRTIWPFIPRAYHVGFAGYNRLRGMRLSYEELKKTIHDKERIKQANAALMDIEPVPTSPVAEWSKLYCAQVLS